MPKPKTKFVGSADRRKVMFAGGKVTEDRQGEFIKRPTALHF